MGSHVDWKITNIWWHDHGIMGQATDICQALLGQKLLAPEQVSRYLETNICEFQCHVFSISSYPRWSHVTVVLEAILDTLHFCCWWVSNSSHLWQRIFCIKLTRCSYPHPSSDHPGNPNPTRFQPTIDPSKCLGIPGDWWQSKWWLWVGARNILLDMCGILNAISPKTEGLLKLMQMIFSGLEVWKPVTCNIEN